MNRRLRREVGKEFGLAIKVGAGQTHPGPVPEWFHQEWERATNPLDDFSHTKRAKQLRKAGKKPNAATKLRRRLRGFKEPRKLSLQGLAYHWEAAPARDDHSRCQSQVNEIRAYHVTHGYVDIAYSFLFCNHGQIFVGRGWGGSAATCGSPWNSTHASACWLGGPGYVPTAQAFAAAKTLGNEAYARGARSFIGHQQACSTACPGPDIMNWLRAGMPGDVVAPKPPEEEDMNGLQNEMLRQTYVMEIDRYNAFGGAQHEADIATATLAAAQTSQTYLAAIYEILAAQARGAGFDAPEVEVAPPKKLRRKPEDFVPVRALTQDDFIA